MEPGRSPNSTREPHINPTSLQGGSALGFVEAQRRATGRNRPAGLIMPSIREESQASEPQGSRVVLPPLSPESLLTTARPMLPQGMNEVEVEEGPTPETHAVLTSTPGQGEGTTGGALPLSGVGEMSLGSPRPTFRPKQLQLPTPLEEPMLSSPAPMLSSAPAPLESQHGGPSVLALLQRRSELAGDEVWTTIGAHSQQLFPSPIIVALCLLGPVVVGSDVFLRYRVETRATGAASEWYHHAGDFLVALWNVCQAAVLLVLLAVPRTRGWVRRKVGVLGTLTVALMTVNELTKPLIDHCAGETAGGLLRDRVRWVADGMIRRGSVLVDGGYAWEGTLAISFLKLFVPQILIQTLLAPHRWGTVDRKYQAAIWGNEILITLAVIYTTATSRELLEGVLQPGEPFTVSVTKVAVIFACLSLVVAYVTMVGFR